MKHFFIIELVLFFQVPFFSFPQSIRGVTSIAEEVQWGTCRAVIVGVSTYANLPQSKQLNYADDDALLFYSYLTNFFPDQPKDNFKLLVNENANANAIRNAIVQQLDESVPGDELIIYFAGHGDVFSDSARRIDDAFLLCYNVSTDADYTISDALSLKNLQELIATGLKKNITVILITDACRSGKYVSSIQGSNATVKLLAEKWNKVIRIASCQENESSFEDQKWGGGHGVFTYYLVNGLKGKADQLKDSVVKLAELERYVGSEVYLATDEIQNPVFQGDKKTALAKVERLIKQEPREKLQTLLAKRSTEDESMTQDTSINRQIFTFRQFLIKNKLISPKGGCALDLYNVLKSEDIPNKLLRKLKGSLVVALQQDAQKMLDIYLSGTSNMPSPEKFAFASDELAVAIDLLGRNHVLSRRIYPRMLFLDAWSIIRAEDRMRYPVAEKEFKKANRLEKNAAYTLNGLGRFYLWNDQFSRAEKYLTLAVKKAPRWNYPRSNLGLVYRGTYRWQMAISKFRELIVADTSFSWGYNNLGCVYFDMQCYPQANYFFRKASQVSLSDPVPLHNLGSVAIEQGRLADGRNMYLSSMKTDTAYAEIYRCLGNYYNNHTDSSATAEKYYLEAVRKEPFFSEMHQALGIYYRGSDRFTLPFLKAEGFLKKAIELNPYNEWSYYDLGYFYLIKRDTLSALRSCLSGVKKNKQSPESYYLVGYMFELINDYKNAQKWYLKSLKKDSLFLLDYKNLSRVFEKTNQFEKAEKVLHQSVDRFPGSPLIPFQLANFYFRQNRIDDAITWYQKTKETDSLYSYAYSSLAYLFLNYKNDFANAKLNFETARSLNPYLHDPKKIAELFKSKGDSIGKMRDNPWLCIGAYKCALQLDSVNVLLQYSLAKAYYLNGITDSSLSIIKKLNEKHNLSGLMKDWITGLQAKLLLDTGDPQQALSLYEEQINHTVTPSYLGKAISLYLLGDIKKAMDFYVVERDENNEKLSEEYLLNNYSPHTILIIHELKKAAGQSEMK